MSNGWVYAITPDLFTWVCFFMFTPECVLEVEFSPFRSWWIKQGWRMPPRHDLSRAAHSAHSVGHINKVNMKPEASGSDRMLAVADRGPRRAAGGHWRRKAPLWWRRREFWPPGETVTCGAVVHVGGDGSRVLRLRVGCITCLSMSLGWCGRR